MPDKPRKYYPAYLDIDNKKCVVFGGGQVAERKVRDLIKAGGNVIVISPELNSALTMMKQKGAIKHAARRFRPTDLKGAFLAIAATNDMQTNRSVAEHAHQMLVNVVDLPELCDFIVPSSLRRGPLTISVSTSGASPALARAIRQQLEGIFGKDVGQHLQKLLKERQRVKSEINDPLERKRMLKELGSPETLSAILVTKVGEADAAQKSGKVESKKTVAKKQKVARTGSGTASKTRAR